MWHEWERREKCTRFLLGKPEGKIPLGRTRHRWEFGITMDSLGNGGDSVRSRQGTVANSCEHGD
jgi:hypothetical protein